MNYTLPDAISLALSKFDIIHLKDIIKGGQMVRIDRKYVFHMDQVPEVLEGMEAEYSIVKVAGKKISTYKSHYLDTANFLFFNQHQRGLVPRDKLRFRTYPSTETTFFEIKHKSNKNITQKDRILRKDESLVLDKTIQDFISNGISKIDPKTLQLSASVNYHRLQFISKDQQERFSIDLNVNASLDGKTVDFGPVAILEIKQNKRSSSPMVDEMQALRLFEVSLSKYCVSLTLLKPDLKSNRFNEIVRLIKKISHQKHEQLETI